jgi:serine acetyltransferase
MGQPEAMTATGPPESDRSPWADPDPDRPVPFWASLRRDLDAHVPPELRAAPRMTRLARDAAIAVRSSGFHVALLYRAAHHLGLRLGMPGRLLAALLSWWVRHWYGCTIAWSARLHGGLILPHPQGIVIGGGTIIGPRGYVFQNVTIGGAPGVPGLPRIGADARIFPGAVIAGPITLGDQVMVGACTVVVRDVPSRTLVRSRPPDLDPLPERFWSRGV